MTPPDRGPAFVESTPGPVRIATTAAPWGPVRVAVTDDAVIGLAILAPDGEFAADVARTSGRDLVRGTSRMLDRAVDAVAAFLAGRPEALSALPLDLAARGTWDRAVLTGVRDVGPGRVTSYGRLATSIGRRGAARAVGGAVGRNPIGLAIPCHRVIAGDGTIGGYGGDWFGSREQLLEIKRELLALEGITLPIRFADGFAER
jgi:O-6-methylguanine DNA methyltransferase